MADNVTHLSANCIKAKLEGDSVNGSQMVMQLMEHKLFEEGANAKKGLKSRATLSDGVSYVSCLITDKTFSKIARDEWEKAVKHSVISVLGSGLQQQTVGGKTILILKEPFQVLYTGLRRTIGSPKDYAKNRDDGTFPTNFDLAIPLNETTERGRNVEARVDEFFDNSNVR
jgi:hypothetical protein|tara:strand:+ start:72 stop:584 length:513 start_codon:yes stop_codon:yes gene_type:complete